MTPQKLIRLSPTRNSQNYGRTFSICLRSVTDGYTAQVLELGNGTSAQPVALTNMVNCQIAATEFFRSRKHYRGYFIADLENALRFGAVGSHELQNGEPITYTMGANMTGWENGFKDSTYDDMSDWEIPEDPMQSKIWAAFNGNRTTKV